jgi:formimidoylglutamase
MSTNATTHGGRMPADLPETIRARLLGPAPLAPAVRDEYERPVADLIRPASEVEGDPLASIVGIPFDTTIMGRRGAKSGPAAVRQALGSCLCYEPGIDVDLSEAPRVADFGDVDVVHTNVDETWSRVTDVVEALVRLGRPLVTIGGDHGLAFPVIRGVARATGGRIGVISVDAHLDVRISHHGEKSSGVPFRYMLEELGDRISGRNFIQFGIAGWLNTRTYREYLRERDVRVITAREIYRSDFDALVAEAIERAADGTDAIYMTFDIDAVEGATVGGTNVPAIAGLSPYQALELVWAFGRHPKAIGFDVMEVSPPWDHSGLSERMAASLVLNFVAGRHVVSESGAASAAGGARRS